jgi:hypothetical protein
MPGLEQQALKVCTWMASLLWFLRFRWICAQLSDSGTARIKQAVDGVRRPALTQHLQEDEIYGFHNNADKEY